MSRFYVGAVVDRVPSPRYFEGASHVELTLQGTPRPATAAKLKAGMPAGATLAVQVPKPVIQGPRGALRNPDPSQLEAFARMATAIGARFIVLAAGVDLTPSARDREALADFAKRLKELGAPALAWQGGGPWDPSDAVAYAQKIGVIPAIDPLEEGLVLEAAPAAYARVRAIGVHARLGDGTLARIAEAILGYGADDTFVAIDSPEGGRRAKRLAQILAGESASFVEDAEEDALDDESDDDDE